MFHFPHSNGHRDTVPLMDIKTCLLPTTKPKTVQKSQSFRSGPSEARLLQWAPILFLGLLSLLSLFFNLSSMRPQKISFLNHVKTSPITLCCLQKKSPNCVSGIRGHLHTETTGLSKFMSQYSPEGSLFQTQLREVSQMYSRLCWPQPLNSHFLCCNFLSL